MTLCSWGCYLTLVMSRLVITPQPSALASRGLHPCDRHMPNEHYLRFQYVNDCHEGIDPPRTVNVRSGARSAGPIAKFGGRPKHRDERHVTRSGEFTEVEHPACGVQLII
jgi:hypothetical protein